MRTTRHTLHRRRVRPARRGERGAALIEMALIAPVFFAALFLIVEGAFFIRSQTSVSRAAVEGARAASIAANSLDADGQALDAITTALGGVDPARVQQVIVYKADRPGGSAPASCLSGPVNGVCNIYTGADLSGAGPVLGCGSRAADRYWCPVTRKVGIAAGANGPPDYVGVQVIYRHRAITGVFFRYLTMEGHGVSRIEAQKP